MGNGRSLSKFSPKLSQTKCGQSNFAKKYPHPRVSDPGSGLPVSWPDGSTDQKLGYIVGDFVSGENIFQLTNAIRQVLLDDCESKCNSNKECSWYYVNVPEKNCFLLRTKRQFLSDIGSKDFIAAPRRVAFSPPTSSPTQRPMPG